MGDRQRRRLSACLSSLVFSVVFLPDGDDVVHLDDHARFESEDGALVEKREESQGVLGHIQPALQDPSTATREKRHGEKAEDGEDGGPQSDAERHEGSPCLNEPRDGAIEDADAGLERSKQTGVEAQAYQQRG